MTPDSASHPTAHPVPCPQGLVRQLELSRPLVGFYDVSDAGPFEPPVRAAFGGCVFAFYDDWAAGRTLHLDAEAFGCPGAGLALLDIPGSPPPDMLHHLVDVEGL
jgi:hypothetical protein